MPRQTFQRPQSPGCLLRLWWPLDGPRRPQLPWWFELQVQLEPQPIQKLPELESIQALGPMQELELELMQGLEPAQELEWIQALAPTQQLGL